MAEILGFGALNWDRILRVDRLAGPGEEIIIKSSAEEAGGSSANTIAALGRLGIKTDFMGKVGNDPEGKRIIDSFKERNVNVDHIMTSNGRTGMIYAFVDDQGERTMYLDPGVNNTVSAEDMDLDALRNSSIIHASSFAGGLSLETLKRLPELIGKARLSYAPGFLSHYGMEFNKDILEKTHILFLNESEVYALTKVKPGPATRILHDKGIEKVLITLGEKGAMVSYNGHNEIIPAFEADVRDTTGAGDAFAAGYLFGELKGFTPSESARIGNFFSKKCIGEIGARKGHPTLEEIQDL